MHAPPFFHERDLPNRETETRRNMSENAQGSAAGKIVEIKGVVIDAVFPEELPEIYSALAIEIPSEDGGGRTLIAEVQ
jgi:F-type H+/Na+-transporting ATPase subunit beta